MLNWKKYDEWTPSNGPTYIAEVTGFGKLMICGEWGTTGDNMRGWRKTRFYRVVAYCTPENTRTEVRCGTCSVASAKAHAARWLDTERLRREMAAG